MILITSYIGKDNLTHHLNLWAKEISNFAKERGVNCVHFHDGHETKPTRDNIEKYLSKNNPSFVYLNGHGNENLVCGYKDEPIIVYDDNEEILKEKIVYIVACKCGEKLGISIVKKGKAKAFIGYNKKFAIAFDKSRYCTPLKDNLPEACKESSNIIPKSIIKGRTVSEAVHASKVSWYKWINFFQRQKEADKAETILWILHHNVDCISIEGETNASIS